ncbi:MAG: hypothetical protein HKN33_18880 [Pyrinomonadaceae bacterium]|nr:hypothetical protein [Pyrinomonadaceae bacterium]
MIRKTFLAFISIGIIAAGVSAQAFKFEGHNIILQVPSTQKSATCAIRYAPPSTQVKIRDLNPSTPLNLKPCNGSSSRLSFTGSSTASVRADSRSYQWCFQGEDATYEIEFAGDSFARNVRYIWPANLSANEDGYYNIKDFGAKGDGRSDDTLAIQSALAYMAHRNGGILRFPMGDYIVGGTPGFEGLAVPSGIVIEGVSGLHSGASTNNVKKSNASRITLRGTNRSLFKVGECTERVTFRDIELYAQNSNRTIGVEGSGAYISSQGFNFERVSFNNFYRGIHVQGLPQSNKQWQFDYVKIKDSRFIYNTDAGLFCDTRNSDWKIEGSLFITPRKTRSQNANAMHFERIGMVLIEDTYGGGFPNALGGTFINILDSGNVTVIGTQAEAMTNSLVYNAEGNQYAGDYSYPITFVNSIFSAPIIFKARRTFVSTGSFYAGDTFQAGPEVRVYSTGDRFCYDGFILKCQGRAKVNFDRATVVFMTGQPSEGGVQGHPTYFGTDVEFGMPIKVPSLNVNALPRGKPNGSLVYCANCRRDSTPCRGGGSGAPAMVVGGRWSCL